MQGFNRYYPPDYDPNNPFHKGNLNRLAGKAAQKPVIRFEMPFNVWCLHCDSHIAQGVRFNAEKRQTGKYLSSPIFSFTMKCHLCTGVIVIATNPKETCYDVLEGAKKKAEEWNAEENGNMEFRADGIAANEDPIYKLEQDATQRVNVKDAQSHIAALLHANDKQWSDPFTQSQRLRRGFRQEKKRLNLIKDAKSKIADRYGLGIDLVDRSIADTIQAKSIDYAPQSQRRMQVRPRKNEAHDQRLVGVMRSNARTRLDPSSEHPLLAQQSNTRVGKAPEPTDTTVLHQSQRRNLVEYDSD